MTASLYSTQSLQTIHPRFLVSIKKMANNRFIEFDGQALRNLTSLLFLYKPLTNLNLFSKCTKDPNFKNFPGSMPLDSPLPSGWLIDLNKLSEPFKPLLPYFQRPSADWVCSGCLQISGQCLGLEKKDSVRKTNQFYDFLRCFTLTCSILS